MKWQAIQDNERKIFHGQRSELCFFRRVFFAKQGKKYPRNSVILVRKCLRASRNWKYEVPCRWNRVCKLKMPPSIFRMKYPCTETGAEVSAYCLSRFLETPNRRNIEETVCQSEKRGHSLNWKSFLFDRWKIARASRCQNEFVSLDVSFLTTENLITEGKKNRTGSFSRRAKTPSPFAQWRSIEARTTGRK